MYRVRVEQVEGTRVRAGGKWLTCIGNRNVRVGDFVQTDGRCVYGYDKESSAPLIITAKKEDEQIIPIQFGNSFGYFSDKIERVGELPFECNSIVNNNKTIAFTSFNVSEGLIADCEYREFWKIVLVLNANCDKLGNVFEFEVSDENYINITKNGEVIKSIPLPENELVIWGFIEDADNWAYVSCTTEYSSVPSQAIIDFVWELAEHIKEHLKAYGDDVPLEECYKEAYYRTVSDCQGDYGAVTYNGKMTFYDSHGTQKDFISFDCNYSRDEVNDEIAQAWMGADVFNYNTINYSGMLDIKFPLQDGFYFTLDEPVQFYRDSIGFPTVIKKTIFSPDDKIILSDYFEIQTNFAVCKTQQNNYLIVPITPDVSAITTMAYTLCTSSHKVAIAMTKPEYDPYRRNYSAFLGTFDYTTTTDEEILVELFVRAEHNSRNVLLVNTELGTVEPQDWKHLGYNLRKMSKKFFKKWFKKES